jgi:hypothetical protein
LAGTAAGKIPGVGPFANPIYRLHFLFHLRRQTGTAPFHFEAVYARITQIVQQQLQQVTTDHVNAAIKNVLQALLVEYDPRKNSSDLTKPADRQFLRREGKKASKP